MRSRPGGGPDAPAAPQGNDASASVREGPPTRVDWPPGPPVAARAALCGLFRGREARVPAPGPFAHVGPPWRPCAFRRSARSESPERRSKIQQDKGPGSCAPPVQATTARSAGGPGVFGTGDKRAPRGQDRGRGARNAYRRPHLHRGLHRGLPQNGQVWRLHAALASSLRAGAFSTFIQVDRAREIGYNQSTHWR